MCCVALAVDVRKEEKLLVSLEHETGEVHGTEVVLRLREIGHQRRQLFGERLGVGGSLDREVDDEMTLDVTRSSWRSEWGVVLRMRFVLRWTAESMFGHEPPSCIAQIG